MPLEIKATEPIKDKEPRLLHLRGIFRRLISGENILPIQVSEEPLRNDLIRGIYGAINSGDTGWASLSEHLSNPPRLLTELQRHSIKPPYAGLIPLLSMPLNPDLLKVLGEMDYHIYATVFTESERDHISRLASDILRLKSESESIQTGMRLPNQQERLIRYGQYSERLSLIYGDNSPRIQMRARFNADQEDYFVVRRETTREDIHKAMDTLCKQIIGEGDRDYYQANIFGADLMKANPIDIYRIYTVQMLSTISKYPPSLYEGLDLIESNHDRILEMLVNPSIHDFSLFTFGAFYKEAQSEIVLGNGFLPYFFNFFIDEERREEFLAVESYRSYPGADWRQRNFIDYDNHQKERTKPNNSFSLFEVASLSRETCSCTDLTVQQLNLADMASMELSEIYGFQNSDIQVSNTSRAIPILYRGRYYLQIPTPQGHSLDEIKIIIDGVEQYPFGCYFDPLSKAYAIELGEDFNAQSTVSYDAGFSRDSSLEHDITRLHSVNQQRLEMAVNVLKEFGLIEERDIDSISNIQNLERVLVNSLAYNVEHEARRFYSLGALGRNLEQYMRARWGKTADDIEEPNQDLANLIAGVYNNLYYREIDSEGKPLYTCKEASQLALTILSWIDPESDWRIVDCYKRVSEEGFGEMHNNLMSKDGRTFDITPPLKPHHEDRVKQLRSIMR